MKVVIELVDRKTGKAEKIFEKHNMILSDFSEAIINTLAGQTPTLPVINVVRLRTNIGTKDLTNPTLTKKTIGYGYRVEVTAEDTSTDSYTLYDIWIGNIDTMQKLFLVTGINKSKPADKTLRITWNYEHFYRGSSAGVTW